jgi:hypothetical protein
LRRPKAAITSPASVDINSVGNVCAIGTIMGSAPRRVNNDLAPSWKRTSSFDGCLFDKMKNIENYKKK